MTVILAFTCLILGGVLIALAISDEDNSGFLIFLGLVGYFMTLVSSGYISHSRGMDDMKEIPHRISVDKEDLIRTDTAYVDTTGEERIIYYYRDAKIVE